MGFPLPASEAAKLAALPAPAGTPTPPPIGRGVAAAAAAARADWLPDDTERWLTDYPLPATFIWNGTRAYPRYRVKFGYGYWLRTAGPYHAALRGLFVLCHEILAACEIMPTQEQLAALLTRHRDRQGTLTLSAEDTAPAAALNPAEDVPGAPAPSPHSAPAVASSRPHPAQTQPTPTGDPDACPF